MKPREVFKTALQDPRLEIELLIPEEYITVKETLDNLPDNILISEWLHTLAYGKYEYHIHNGETAINLKHLYSNGARAGNPRLIRLYSKKDLINIIHSTLKA